MHAPTWKPVRWGLVALVALQVLGLNALAWRESSALNAQQASLQNILKTTFPSVTLVIDAPLQMQREVDVLQQKSGAASSTDFESEQAMGLINCFEGYSTFKARPLLNIHDIAVLPAHRGQGVGQALLAAAQDHALKRGCCKLTLEVLTGNATALASYHRFGFEAYALDPAAGQASFMHKWL